MSAETKAKTLRMQFLSLKRIHDKFHPNEATAKSEGDTSMTYAELLQMVDLLATNLAKSIEGLLEARAERDNAIRERDEARRLACGALASGGWDLFAKPDDWGVDRGRDLCMRDQADERKWDCFKKVAV